ncbi:hypothetical protein KSB_25030 [Ktedonobacter robiniae]|uniref:Uncharacterized protein n=1 Tax=Ktedonobacter robiniae TaxID=2778365 RepID=A0ABQ3UMV5_9CHLR|nr:hypothetical protein KSB_25030 [Ktedonobacter robiniae]
MRVGQYLMVPGKLGAGMPEASLHPTFTKFSCILSGRMHVYLCNKARIVEERGEAHI